MTGSTLKAFWGAGLGIVLTIPAGWAQPLSPARQKPGCVAEARPDRLQALSPEGDLVLASGFLARLAGIRLPDEAPHRAMAVAWLQDRAEQPVLIQAAAGPDRWGRIPARIRSSGQTPPVDWSHVLVEAGLAMVDAGLDDPFCQPELLAFEATARERRLGLWADDRYKPVDVNESERLRDRIGSFVLVEGRVRSIGERKQRTYLNFGGHWAEDFTIIIPRKTWKQMSDRGMGAEALKNRQIRARGILQSWQGAAFSIVIPDMIERLEDGRLP
ncbi:thermonuclease family protein [Microvirga terrae]|uniref:Thermonuclease family protein n=1 Tax=Microvirga terrae TaxID=2740529 RepID=A0ABY5RUT7_9HYPH|nr:MULTISPECIES: thermonuclease family protein [Microvirga]MBQ0824109.1 thermonuclease family protein [Microvirga sp. HBU67558]UVF20059.1 thermonuclease family protein [Microvirga terrae]